MLVFQASALIRVVCLLGSNASRSHSGRGAERRVCTAAIRVQLSLFHFGRSCAPMDRQPLRCPCRFKKPRSLYGRRSECRGGEKFIRSESAMILERTAS